MSNRHVAPSERVRVKRRHERGHYDAETIHRILDTMPVCSVGYVFKGSPYVTPTLQWREGSHIYWHGSSASRMLEAVEQAQACVTVTIIDGFVMARSAFHHSANYRSVMVLGTARKITDNDEKEVRLKIFVDTLFPPLGHFAADEERGTQGDDGDVAAAQRSLGESSHRRAKGR